MLRKKKKCDSARTRADRVRTHSSTLSAPTKNASSHLDLNPQRRQFKYSHTHTHLKSEPMLTPSTHQSFTDPSQSSSSRGNCSPPRPSLFGYEASLWSRNLGQDCGEEETRRSWNDQGSSPLRAVLCAGKKTESETVAGTHLLGHRGRLEVVLSTANAR